MKTTQPAQVTSAKAAAKPAQNADTGQAAHGQAAELSAAAIATAGVAGAADPLPHAQQVQASFGRHDIAGIRARVGGAAQAASAELGASAYAIGDQVGFAVAPTVHTAAHEAAHVVQHRSGVQLEADMGPATGVLERHADRVADAVVAGRSAESLLDAVPAGAPAAVQLRRKATRAPTTKPAKSAKSAKSAGVELSSAQFGAQALDRFILTERLSEMAQLVAGTGFPRGFFVGLQTALVALGAAPIKKAEVLGGTRRMRAALDGFMATTRSGVDSAALQRRRADILMTRLLPEIKAIEQGAEPMAKGARAPTSIGRVMDHLQGFLSGQKDRAAGQAALKTELAGTTQGTRFSSFCIGSYVTSKAGNPELAKIAGKNAKAGEILSQVVGKPLPFRVLYTETATHARLHSIGEAGTRATVDVAQMTMAKPNQTGATARRRRFGVLLGQWATSQGQMPRGKLALSFQGVPFRRSFKVTALWAQIQRWLARNPTFSTALFVAGLAAMGLSGLGTLYVSALASTMGAVGAMAVGAMGVSISALNLYARSQRGTLLTDWRGSMIDLLSVVAGATGLAAGAATLAEDVGMWWLAHAAQAKFVSKPILDGLQAMAPWASRLHGLNNLMAMSVAPTAYLLAMPDVFKQITTAFKSGKTGDVLWHTFVGIAGGALTFVSMKGAVKAEGVNTRLAQSMVGRPDVLARLPVGLQARIKALAAIEGPSPRAQGVLARQTALTALGKYADPKVTLLLAAMHDTLGRVGRAAQTQHGAKAKALHDAPLTDAVTGGVKIEFRSKTTTTDHERLSGNMRTPGQMVKRGEDRVHAVDVFVGGVFWGKLTVRTAYRDAPNAEFGRQLTGKPHCSVQVDGMQALQPRSLLFKIAKLKMHGLTVKELKALYGSAAVGQLQKTTQKAGKAGVVGTTTGAPLTGPASGAADPHRPHMTIVGAAPPDAVFDEQVSSHLHARRLLVSAVFAHLKGARLAQETRALPGPDMLIPKRVVELPSGAVTPGALEALLRETFEGPSLPTATGKRYAPGLDYHPAASDPKQLEALASALRWRWHTAQARAGLFDAPETVTYRAALGIALRTFDATQQYERFKRGLQMGAAEVLQWRFGVGTSP